MKHLRRRVIMRQYDYIKYYNNFVPSYYDTGKFVPITLKELEQERMVYILRKTDTPKPRQHREVYVEDLEYPRNYLRAMEDFLYSRKYTDWFSDYDEDGYMWIQARSNTPRSLLGWATFELDY